MNQSQPSYSDYLSVAWECRPSPDQLAALEAMEGRNFPEDRMMFELHTLRVIEQIRAGRVKLQDALSATT